MKKILFLMLFPLLAFGQTIVEVTPIVSTTQIYTRPSTASDTLVADTAGQFGSVTVGMRVVGAGIPFGTKVKTIIDTSTVEISANATLADTIFVRFAYFTSLAYSAGDAFGFPFTIQPFHRIDQIIVEDDAKQITSVDMIFFDSTFVETADNAAIAPADSDAKNIIGYATVGGTGFHKVMGNNHVLVMPFTNSPINFGTQRNMYVQMIVVGTPTMTAVNNLRVRFIGE